MGKKTTPQELMEIVKYFALKLIDYPDEFVISDEMDGQAILLNVKVNPLDVGKLIGKEGRTADALRTLLFCVAAKNGTRCNIRIGQ